ncbi:MAG: hypothetical protein AB7I38_05335 [Dehalococcoidia bacterium]
MPARKTTAERRQALSQRRNLTTLAIGAIPVAILLILGGIFLYNRLTGLGPNELPATIGEGERAEIRATIEDFYGFVNEYNPEFIASTMLPVPELGEEEFSRLVMEVAPLQSEALTFTVLSLGSTARSADEAYVQARVATNYGSRDFRLARRDGQWKLAAVPDLLVPQEAGPMRVEWSVLHSAVVDPMAILPTATATASPSAPASSAAATSTPEGSATPVAQATPTPSKMLLVTGRIKNLSAEPGYVLSASAFVTDGAGKTLVTARPPMPGNPYLNPGEEGYFQVQMTFPRTGEQLDPQHFVLVPDFRQVGRTDEATYVSDLVVVTPASFAWPLPADPKITLTSSDPRQVTAQVFGYFFDASGTPLFISPVSPTLGLPAGSSVDFPLGVATLPEVLGAVARVDFVVYANPPRPEGR